MLYHITGKYLNGDNYGTTLHDIMEVSDVLFEIKQQYYYNESEDADIVDPASIEIETERE